MVYAPALQSGKIRLQIIVATSMGFNVFILDTGMTNCSLALTWAGLGDVAAKSETLRDKSCLQAL